MDPRVGLCSRASRTGSWFRPALTRRLVCTSRQVPKDALESSVLGAIEDVLAEPELAIGMAVRLRDGTDHAARLAELARELSHLDESQDRLVDLYTDGEFAKDGFHQKREKLTRRHGALDREQAQLRSECEPGPDPKVLREQVPQVLGFIREWVRRADGDDLELLLQALNVRVEVSPEEADVRVEVPMIEGADFVTIERTSVSLFRADQFERVPLVATAPIRRREGGGRATRARWCQGRADACQSSSRRQ